MAERATDQEMTLTGNPPTIASPKASHLCLRPVMRATVAVFAVLLLVCLGLLLGSDRAGAKAPIFSFINEPSTTEAGGHPDIITKARFGNRLNQGPSECGCNSPRDIVIENPEGVVANPHVADICTAAEAALYQCSANAQVGVFEFTLYGIVYAFIPIYRTVPQAGQGGLFVFTIPLVTAIPEYLAFNARTEGDYGLNTEAIGITQGIPLEDLRTIFWGVPGAHSNDYLRFKPTEALIYCNEDPWESVTKSHTLPASCVALGFDDEGHQIVEPKPSIPTSIPIRPMIQNPTTCEGPLTTSVEVTAYDNETDRASQTWPATTGCDVLSFNPSLSANPTTRATDTPAGTDIKLDVPQFQDASTPSPSEIRSSTVVLPQGFSLNPSAADGKILCSESQAHLHTRIPAECPEVAKIGTLSLDSAALPAPIPGYIYLFESKPGDRYRFLLTANGYGTAVKIPGSIHADEQTGQLTFVLDDLPQSPVQEFDMHFFGSERGALATPTKCGTYPVETTFVPWDDQLSPQKSTQFFVLDQGPNGSPCPGDRRPFGPSFEAGSVDNTAGAHSEFTLRLSRSDGQQELTGLVTTTPPGFLATLKGVSYCPEPTLAQIGQASYAGVAELISPACPAQSQVGTVVGSVGAGSRPTYQPGKVYLAGPYKGSPLSLVVVVPAVTGPYDVGNVVIRVAVAVNPVTSQVTAVSDPLPQIIGGVPLRLRSVLLRLDRPRFALNPTNCDPFSVRATMLGSEGSTSNASVPYQVANCADLPYKPRLALKLSGGVGRRGHPAIHAVLTASPGESNSHSVSVTLPKGEQLDNRHIQTVCTRGQFANSACPQGSKIGQAEVTTPLLAEPLKGSVYLRSSTNQLPDLVLDLKGQVDFEAIAKVDSVNARLRTTFASVPDVPISKVVLDLAGGKKGLLINSEPLCGSGKKATVRMTGQNGAVFNTKAKLRPACGSKARHKRHSDKRKAG
jgi:hypothetical protein